ncbi:MAG: efflux RND transporter permease subunit, partial [Zavarzinella sp.]|nr:efflux RND transporter permease subunit [Zavarzinella sp.]
RTIVIRADPGAITSRGLSADDVVQALSRGNSISPSGAIREQERMPLVPVNTMAATPKDFGDIPVKPGVFLRDVVVRNPATGEPLIEDATDIPTGYALVNGKRAVYILATKKADASTLEVIDNIKTNLPQMQAVLPDDIKVSFEFDQSPYVTNSLRGVAIEAGLGAILTGLMVLVFLRDWRSVIVVVLNIPLALVASLVALALSGQSVNLMTLGGLALAVGILVDEATVAVENIHTQLERTDSVAVAVWRAIQETQFPRLLAMLCILAVFIPSFVMKGAARALFVPLSLAVAFAMVASYLLSSTFVPVLSVWLLKRPPAGYHDPGAKLLGAAVRPAVWLATRTRWVLVPAYLAGAGLLLFILYRSLGTEIFPQVDSGQFQFRLKAPTGTRIEETEEVVKEALRVIGEEAGGENVDITVGWVGIVPSSYPINSIYMWTGGPEEAVVRVALKPGRVRLERLKSALREKLNAHLPAWLEDKWLREGVPPARAATARNLRLSFEPADIVNEVMSFGSPTPVEIQVSGTKMADNRAYAEKIRQELAKVKSLKDLEYVQAQDYPTVEVSVNREKAARAGLQAGDVGSALSPATSSSRFTVPSYWRDPASGVAYQVQVEVPQKLMRSARDVATVPVHANGGSPILVRDVADVKEGVMPGQVDRYNQRRLVSLTADIEGDDLGDVAAQITKALAAAGDRPAGVNVDVRGQVAPFQEMFRWLGYGLLAAVAVIFLLLTAYFQSVRLTLTALAAVPAVLCGVALALLLTGSTLNLQSFMGAIMAVGVAVANAILLVTFAERARVGGQSAADP